MSGEERKEYLVRNSTYALWWRADSKGYTDKVEEAGLYTREMALGILNGSGCERGEGMLHVSDAIAAGLVGPDQRHLFDAYKNQVKREATREVLDAMQWFAEELDDMTPHGLVDMVRDRLVNE